MNSVKFVLYERRAVPCHVDLRKAEGMDFHYVLFRGTFTLRVEDVEFEFSTLLLDAALTLWRAIRDLPDGHEHLYDFPDGEELVLCRNGEDVRISDSWEPENGSTTKHSDLVRTLHAGCLEFIDELKRKYPLLHESEGFRQVLGLMDQ